MEFFGDLLHGGWMMFCNVVKQVRCLVDSGFKLISRVLDKTRRRRRGLRK